MNFTKALAVLGLLAVVGVSGCNAGDPPTQGVKPTAAQFKTDIDRLLDNLQRLPLDKRYIARKVMDRAVAGKGTEDQKARYKQLMEEAPMMPLLKKGKDGKTEPAPAMTTTPATMLPRSGG